MAFLYYYAEKKFIVYVIMKLFTNEIYIFYYIYYTVYIYIFYGREEYEWMAEYGFVRIRAKSFQDYLLSLFWQTKIIIFR